MTVGEMIWGSYCRTSDTKKCNEVRAHAERAWQRITMQKVCFDGMDDDRVLDGIERVVRRSNEITAEVLAYLIEVEKRGLHLRPRRGWD